MQRTPAAAPAPTSPPHTREAILKAACEVIAETGFENIRMRMVAERAGVSTAALHYHFETRENLFAEALHYSFGRTGADVYEAQGNGDTATARLARIISASLPLTPSLRQEWAMWQELWCRAARDPESRTLAIDLYRAHTSWIEETLAAGIAVGGVRCPATRPTHAQLISSLCDGFGVQLMMSQPHGDPGRRPHGDLVDRDRARSGSTSRSRRTGADDDPRAAASPAAASCSGAAGAALARVSTGLRLHQPSGSRRRCRRSRSCRRSTATSSTSTGPSTSTPRCSRASRGSTASRSSSRTSTPWRACRPSSLPGTATTSSSRRRSGCRSSTPPTSCTRSTTRRSRTRRAIFDHYDYFADPWYDAGSAHSVPFTMYKTGIAWRKDKLGDQLSGSWNDLWNETASGRTFVLDDRDEVLGMAALLLGLPLNTADEDELDEIVDEMDSLRPHLRASAATTTATCSRATPGCTRPGAATWPP